MVYITYAYRPEIEALAGLAAGSPLCCRFIRARAGGAGKALAGVLAEAATGRDTTGAPDIIVNAGFAGALRPDLDPGEVVFVSELANNSNNSGTVSNNSGTVYRITEPEFGILSPNYRPRITPVRCVTVTGPVLEAVARDRLRQTTGADIVDMEALYLYETARRYGVPFLSLKVVSDKADAQTRATAVGQAPKWSKILGQAVYDLLESSWK